MSEGGSFRFYLQINIWIYFQGQFLLGEWRDPPPPKMKDFPEPIRSFTVKEKTKTNKPLARFFFVQLHRHIDILLILNKD